MDVVTWEDHAIHFFEQRASDPSTTLRAFAATHGLNRNTLAKHVRAVETGTTLRGRGRPRHLLDREEDALVVHALTRLMGNSPLTNREVRARALCAERCL